MLAKFIIFVCLLQISKGIPPKLSQSLNVKGYFSPLIVGGEYAPYGHSKHMVALIIDSELKILICGGSILTRQHVLTAAHCIHPFVVWDVLLRDFIGIVGSNYWNSTETKVPFSGYLIHPEWNGAIAKNDVGILFPKEAIQFNDLVGPITLNYDWVNDGETCFVTGWGREGEWLSVPDRLKLLNVDTISPTECVQGIEYGAKVTGWAPPHDPAIELCTFHSAGQGVCNGDSGSALVLKKSGQQVGIVSWGFPCAIGAPDVFVRISGFQDFLLSAMKKYVE